MTQLFFSVRRRHHLLPFVSRSCGFPGMQDALIRKLVIVEDEFDEECSFSWVYT
jgi:hypothetical protein